MRENRRSIHDIPISPNFYYTSEFQNVLAMGRVKSISPEIVSSVKAEPLTRDDLFSVRFTVDGLYNFGGIILANV